MLSPIKILVAACLVTLLVSVEWLTDFDKARHTAAEQDKNIILVFAGSDWCAPCIKLEQKIWESDEFKAEAAQKWVLVKADFPKKKANALPEAQTQHNAALYEKYNKEGVFPLVVVIDKTGKVLGKTTYKDITPAEYIKHLHTLEGK
ncbi:thiol-disulfide isomerase [Flavobacterium akiainvivens]|uniref:Thiol-disulfide isomerase n=1 Tax=Flavobacterium akiainvivens TaxID=1202724 RepID=A0A0M9VJT0_9FLAO|nr:thioredoxin family protein [Flavobacterium akiainvivens]KOS08089.1 thiol-disulfide isomerase [Flavobacterium akiainvivens]SFQ71717.1 Thiol-disulfide isomerase or thioredoxin [Flavobacterium akiainvivens]